MNFILPPFIHNHLAAILIALWVGSNFVVAMPAPTAQSSPYYKWLFASLHGIFGAVPRIVATMFPGAAKWFTFGNSNGSGNPTSSGGSNAGSRP